MHNVITDNTHTHTQPFYCSSGICPGHTRVSRYQKGKTRQVKTRDVPDFGSGRSGIRPLLANPAKFGSGQNFCWILPDLRQLSSLLVAYDNSL